MIVNAWYRLLQYHLSFGFFDKFNEAVLHASLRYGFDSTVFLLMNLLKVEECETKDIIL